MQSGLLCPLSLETGPAIEKTPINVDGIDVFMAVPF